MSKRKNPPQKRTLQLPDLDQAKSAVLNSLPSKESLRGYRHADEFIGWYCSEPRLSFSKAVVTRYRIQQERRGADGLRVVAAVGTRRTPLPACSKRGRASAYCHKR